MTVIRDEAQGLAWIRARLGRAWIVAEDGVPLNVHGNCAGVVARTFLGHAAGYRRANLIADAVRTKLRKDWRTAPDGAVHLWKDSKNGHIATQSRRGYVICNKRTKPGSKISTIQEVPLSYYRGLRYVGWVHAWEIPGWGPLRPRVKPAAVKPSPAKPAVVRVVRLADLKVGRSTNSAAYVNAALVALGYLHKSAGGSRWTPESQLAFRAFRSAKRFKPTQNREAFVALGKGRFTVR